MTADQIKCSTTADLRVEYFNLREYLKVEYLRAFLPTILFSVAIAFHSWPLQSDNEEIDRWIFILPLLWPYLITVTAFVCAFGIMYFGGRAWRSTKVAIAIRSELFNRAG